MSVDPRSLNYPGINDDNRQTADEGLEPQPQSEREDRRTGTNDELKELDRAERRKK